MSNGENLKDGDIKTACILSIDMIGSTPLSDKFNDKELYDTKIALHKWVKYIIQKRTGSELNWGGDGGIYYFIYENIIKRVVTRAVVSAKEMIDNFGEFNDTYNNLFYLGKRNDIQIRIGIDFGNVVYHSDKGDWHSSEINSATKIQGKAEPNSILISSSAFKELEDLLKLEFETFDEKYNNSDLYTYPKVKNTLENIENPKEPLLIPTVIKSFTENITPPVPNFVGRVDDINTITRCYESEKTKIGAIIGLGGEGKSSIARKWFDTLLSTKTEPHIFWWGFYRNNSIDRFLNSLVTFINGKEIEIKDSWGKVDWIKHNIGSEKYLIILDGLEEMQKGEQGEPFGKMIHVEFRELLTWCADHLNGLVLITTRFPMKDIEGYIGNKYENIELEGLSVKDSRDLFNKIGVKGEQKDFDKII